MILSILQHTTVLIRLAADPPLPARHMLGVRT
jgi:hypothetical protein